MNSRKNSNKRDLVLAAKEQELADEDTLKSMTKTELLGMLGETDEPAALEHVKLNGAHLFPQAVSL